MYSDLEKDFDLSEDSDDNADDGMNVAASSNNAHIADTAMVSNAAQLLPPMAVETQQSIITDANNVEPYVFYHKQNAIRLIR